MTELIVKDYLGSSIEFKMINGEVYANATSMASAFDKGAQKLKDWKRSNKTKELIDELNKINEVENSHIELIISSRGGLDNGETFIHETLTLDFAQYLSIGFRVWCQTQITTLMRDGTVSLASKSEEDMLLALFPTAPQNLLSLTAHNIREVKKLTQEVTHKEDVIVGLVGDIDLATKRQRITQIVRHNSKNYQDRYNLLYLEFEKKFHVNLKMRLESDFALSIKPKIKNKMDLIERGLLINGQHRNMIPELYEIACKVFENNIKELVKEWESVVGGN